MKKIFAALVLAVSVAGIGVSAEASETNLETGATLTAAASTMPAVGQHGRRMRRRMRRHMRRRMRRHMRRERRGRRHMRRRMHGHDRM